MQCRWKYLILKVFVLNIKSLQLYVCKRQYAHSYARIFIDFDKLLCFIIGSKEWLYIVYYGNIFTSGMQECAECWARCAEEWVKARGTRIERYTVSEVCRCAHCDIENPDKRPGQQSGRPGSHDKIMTVCRQCVIRAIWESDTTISEDVETDIGLANSVHV